MSQPFARPDLYNAQWALARAVEVAGQSPCQKSKRGVVIWREGWPFHAAGWNHQPAPLACDGSAFCRANCAKLCVHAETHALLGLPVPGLAGAYRADMLHVKVVGGKAVPSGLPSCWQCSRLILDRGIRQVWLLHDAGLTAYSAENFHRVTLRTCDLEPT
jgi:deoxycytidylate deaminase